MQPLDDAERDRLHREIADQQLRDLHRLVTRRGYRDWETQLRSRLREPSISTNRWVVKMQ